MSIRNEDFRYFGETNSSTRRECSECTRTFECIEGNHEKRQFTSVKQPSN